MQNQSSVWLNIRRDRPDWIYLQGWGAMNPTAVREAGRAGFPVEKLVGVWWAGSDDDPRPAGPAGKGYKALNWHQTGADFPALQEIIKNVHDKGQSLTTKEKVGENLYNRGVYQGVVVAEAIRNAQRLSGKKAVTGEDVRRGLETLNITEARWAELGLPGFAAALKLSCDDHNGHNQLYVMEWDGAKWTRASQQIQTQKDKVRPLIDAGREGLRDEQPGLAAAVRGLRPRVVGQVNPSPPPRGRVAPASAGVGRGGRGVAASALVPSANIASAPYGALPLSRPCFAGPPSPSRGEGGV
jgi:branched-chain amino acid transport system substrate-binding protein